MMRTILLFVLLFGWVHSGFANVVFSATRIIYPATATEVNLSLINHANTPALMQVWVDRFGDDAASASANEPVPFLVTPPIFRMEPNEGQSIRLLYTHEALPQDRESIFRFNALEVPSKPAGAQNYVQIAIASELKLFFRPSNLSHTLADAAKKLSWFRQGKDIVVKNDSPLHVSLSQMSLLKNGQILGTESIDMVAPFSEQHFALKSMGATKAAQADQVQFTYVNDYGATTKLTLPLQ